MRLHRATPKLHEPSADALAQMIGSGKTDSEIGRELAIAPRRIWALRKHYGLAPSKPGWPQLLVIQAREIKALCTGDVLKVMQGIIFQDSPEAVQADRRGFMPYKPDPATGGGSSIICTRSA